MRQLKVRNGQRTRKLDLRLVRNYTRTILQNYLELKSWMLAIDFVSATRMADLNWEYLRHEGSTDVITFDFRDGYEDPESEDCELAGQIFISVDDALKQAQEFSTTWQDELARYVIHGVLHLRGYDDLSPGKRAVMKREENRLLRLLLREFPLKETGPSHG